MQMYLLEKRLLDWKKKEPAKFSLFCALEGRCQNCQTNFDTSIRRGAKGELVMFCRECWFLYRETARMGMSEESYLRERGATIREVVERSQLKVAPKKGKPSHKRDLDRDLKVFELHLLGRSHAHIARSLNISRERVRQIVYRFKK